MRQLQSRYITFPVDFMCVLWCNNLLFCFSFGLKTYCSASHLIWSVIVLICSGYWMFSFSFDLITVLLLIWFNLITDCPASHLITVVLLFNWFIFNCSSSQWLFHSLQACLRTLRATEQKSSSKYSSLKNSTNWWQTSPICMGNSSWVPPTYHHQPPSSTHNAKEIAICRANIMPTLSLA